MPTNEYLPFATAGGANVMAQNDYNALGVRGSGFQAGEAESERCNKVWRQSSVVAAAVGKVILDSLEVDVLDNGDVAALAVLIRDAIRRLTGNSPPVPLTDGANIAVNAALGSIFTVTIAGNRTLDNATGMYDGQPFTFVVTQGSGGNRLLGYGSIYAFEGNVDPVLSTTAGAVDILAGFYLSATNKIHLVLASKGSA